MNLSNIRLKSFLVTLLAICAWSIGFSQDADPSNQPSPSPTDRLAAILKRFPTSDANKDGTLSREEAASFFQQRREGRNNTPRTKANQSRLPAPSHADVKYGEHQKQAFDIWLVPDTAKPTPLILFIHGGGFRSGDKKTALPSMVEKCLNAGVAFAAMNYRLSDIGPYPMMMEDCARGLQTIRHRASEWNVDPGRIASYGGSAGAGISLWLGFHEDLATPESEDPISRESTRVVAVATMNGQSTYDINDFREWYGVPNLQPGPALPAFYRVTSEDDWKSERVRKLMTDASSINHLTKDDAPVYMIYSRPNTDITVDTSSSEWVHHVKLGLKLQSAMQKLGLECIVRGPDVTPKNDPYGSFEDFLIKKVKG